MSVLIALFAIAFFFLSIRSLRSAFFLCIALLPFSPRYVAIAIGQNGLALSSRRLMFYCLLLSIIVHFAHKANFGKEFKNTLASNSKFYLLLLAYYLVKLLSTILASGAIIYWLDEAIVVFVTLFLANNYITNDGVRKKLIILLLGSFLISSCLGFIEYMLGHPILQGLVDIEVDQASTDVLSGKFRDDSYRIMAGFDNPLLLAEFTCVITGFLWLYRRLKYGFGYLLIVLSFITLAMTASRSGILVWLTVFATIFFYMYAQRANRYFRSVFYLLLFVTVSLFLSLTIYFVQHPDVFIRLVPSDTSSANSTLERAAQYGAAALAIAGSPLIGVGMMQNVAEQVDAINHLDNYYLRVMLEGGVIGLIFYLMHIVYPMLSAIKGISIANAKRERHLLISILSSIMAFSLYKLFLSMPYNNVYFYLIVGVLFGIRQDQGDRQRSSRRAN